MIEHDPNFKVITFYVRCYDDARLARLTNYSTRSDAARAAIRDLLLLDDAERYDALTSFSDKPGPKQIVTVYLPIVYIDAMQEFTIGGLVLSRSHVMRCAIDLFLDREEALLKCIGTGLLPELVPVKALIKKLRDGRIDMRTCRTGWENKNKI